MVASKAPGEPGRGGDRDPLLLVGVQGGLNRAHALVGLARGPLDRLGELDLALRGPLAERRVAEPRDVRRGHGAVGGRRGRELVGVGDPRRLHRVPGDRPDSLGAQLGPVGIAGAVIDPAAHPQPSLPGLGQALDLALEDADLAPDRVLDVGLGVAGAGRQRRVHSLLGGLPQVHGRQSRR